MADNGFQYHLFTPDGEYPGEIEIISRFLRYGLDYLHVRKPGLSQSMTEKYVLNLPEQYRNQIVLHDHPALAAKYGLGFQINTRNHNAIVEGTRLSASCHSLDELQSLPDGISFITLSPVFDSISKPGYKANSTIADLKSVRYNFGIIGLGGVTTENFIKLQAAGYDGAAFLGDVWHNTDGVDRFFKLLLMSNFSLQFITDAPDQKGTVNQARQALAGGCRWIQVRMKNASLQVIADTLTELRPIIESYGATLIVDDYVELCHLTHGVHLGQNDMPVSEARKLLTPDKIIGLTVNNADHIVNSYECLPDYYGCGPYRFTSTKKNLAPVLGIDGYKNLAPLFRKKFVAIGGILPDDIPVLLQAGASGIAVSSVITHSDDISLTTNKIINIIRQCKTTL